MVIRDLTTDECLAVLSRAKVFRLACVRENQPYVVPLSLAYDKESGNLYGFVLPGQKLEWMRANPRICIEVDDVSAHDRWASVIGFGCFEELQDSPTDEGSIGSAVPLRDAMPQTPNGSFEPISPDGVNGRVRPTRHRAWQTLKREPMWWETGCRAWEAHGHRGARESSTPIYYSVKLDNITGRQASPNGRMVISDAETAPRNVR